MTCIDIIIGNKTKVFHCYNFQVLELLSCDCKRKCNRGDCPCIDNGFLCTNVCKVKDCENTEVDSDSDNDEEYDKDSNDLEVDADE